MKFHLRVYGNFHYMDEDEAYNSGQFETYAEALIQAKVIVDRFLDEQWKKGITPVELDLAYTSFGEDLLLFPMNRGGGKFFGVEVCGG
ncbi:MAG: hypothetical protein IPI54_12905 [Chitinophagaceae bacterium]|nr:hypothetical protein [Chitinophagaceae bacterium]